MHEKLARTSLDIKSDQQVYRMQFNGFAERKASYMDFAKRQISTGWLRVTGQVANGSGHLLSVKFRWRAQ